MRLPHLLLCFFNIALLNAQPSDSLMNALRNAEKNDIQKVKLLNEVAYQYRTSDPNKVTQYGEAAFRLASAINDETQKAAAMINLGTAKIITGDYKDALNYFSDAVNLLETTTQNSREAKKLLGRAYGSIGIVFSEQSNYAKALQYHLKSVRIYESFKDSQGMARLYNNIGIVYYAQHEDYKALQYFLKALNIQQQRSDPSRSITLTNIGNSYLRRREYPKALQSYREAETALAEHPDARAEGELYNNLGQYYFEQNNYQAAVSAWNIAVKKFSSIGDKFGVGDTYMHFATLYYSQKDPARAIEYSQKALSTASSMQIPEQVAAAEKMIAESYRSTGNHAAALEHFTRYAEAKEQLNSSEALRISVQAEMEFDFEKREALQKKELEKKELLFNEASKRHTMQIIFAALISIMLCGILFLIYSRVQLRRNLTMQKELAEYEQKALHLQMNPHFVFNCLGSISSFIVQNGTDEAIKYLSKFSKLMRLTLEYSKESLIPVDREIESLQNYLELEQLRFNNKFDFKIAKSPQIEDDMALPPLLLQPFVENAIIHGLIPKSLPGSISVEFAVAGDNIICTITDDGIGYNHSQKLRAELVSVHKSMALDITKKRLQMMESVTSKRSHVEIVETHDATGNIAGTKVVLTLPIQYIDKRA